MLITHVKKIPTNVITGFLGVGKTSVILNLLDNKPDNEHWAVLVNEFGEVGIDGSSLTGCTHEEHNVHIKEVPGGCMCCASGVSMRVALNTLLRKHKPDRLLIEPSGIGHAEGVVDILQSQDYRNIIELYQTLVLVDARKITDERYHQHPIYLQQLDVADIIIANKADLYTQDDLTHLTTFLDKRFCQKNKPLYPIHHATLPVSLITETKLNDGDSTVVQPYQKKSFRLFQPPVDTDKNQPVCFPDNGFIRIDNTGGDFSSCGWIFKPEMIFDTHRLTTLLSGISAERVKGIFKTEGKPILYNIVDGEFIPSSLNEARDSRLEIITQNSEIFEPLEANLLACVVPEPM